MTSPAELRRALVPAAITYPEDLPITQWRERLLETIRDHQVVIVAGETGSGKSTQLPKICLELGRGVEGRIGHTQPRRIAARAIAERIAEELGSPVGGLVGYTVRFTDEVEDHTAIKVMTDGILLNELQRDRDLRQYDTVIVDEAHERSLNVDFLLGYLKQLLPRRPDLKVIVTSATIDTARFSQHFDDAPIVEVEGRTYPVEVRYRPLIDARDGEARDQSQAICDALVELAAEDHGDVLVFCSGEREIRDAVDAIRDMGLRHTEVLPLFGRLSAAEQHRVFAPHTGRRIVVATNVAETSLTVPGIRFVVDTGAARISRYSRRTKVQQLPIEPVSRASADQRAGRCGRLGPGICIRLYDREDYDRRPEFTDPEVVRTNLASVLLQMAAAGLGEIDRFPFIDAPDARAIRDGINLLEELDAVRGEAIGTSAWLTPVGRRLARIPIDPRLARMLIESDGNACLDEVLTIVSALSIQDPRDRPLGKEQAADEKHRRFADADSDFVSWLHLWKHISSEREQRTSGQFRRMCADEFLNWRRIREWQDLRAQLRRVARRLGMHPNRKPGTPELIHESLLAGLLSHVGRKDPDSWEYRGARGARFSIRPGSVLFKRAPEWVMAGELIETTRTWATDVAAVSPEAIERVGSHLVRRSVSDPWWDAGRGAAVARETSTLYGLSLSTDRVVLYDRFDVASARDLFIRHALVAGEWETHHAFARRNDEQFAAIEEIETRERRTDVLATEDAIAAFFDERIPGDVTSTRAFDAWWKDAKERDPHLLDLQPADLTDPHARPADAQAYPRIWSFGDIELPVSYEFDPHSAHDGVTIDVPLEALDRLDPAVFAWNVPGVRAELIESLIRTLPKAHRRRFAPIPDTARNLADRTDEADASLVAWLSRELTRLGGELVKPDEFSPESVPPHLLPRFRVVRQDGTPVGEGDDLGELRDRLRRESRREISSAGHTIEQTGLTGWTFGDLPRTVEIHGDGHTVTAYPSIVDEEDSVAIRLVATEDEQWDASWRGLRRLILLSLPSPRGLLRAVLARHRPLPITGSPYRDEEAWMEDCLGSALDAVMAAEGGLVWDAQAFEDLVEGVRTELADAIEAIGEDAAQALLSLHALNLALDDTPGAFADVIADIDQQVDRFLFPGFLTAVGADRIDDVRRYLDGATYRIRRVAEHPDRDRVAMDTVQSLERELDELSEVLPVTPDLVALAWMIQELRMSLFAQPIGARGPVSAKRVRAALDALLA